MTETHTMQHWQDQEWDTFSDHLKTELLKGPATVVFTKVDGAQRVMNCTLNHKLLPALPVTESKATDKPVRKKSNSAVVVFDLDKQQWRSFKLKSVLFVKVA